MAAILGVDSDRQNGLEISRDCWKLPKDTCWPKPMPGNGFQQCVQFNCIVCLQKNDNEKTMTQYFQWRIWQEKHGNLETVCLHCRGVSFVLLQFCLECFLAAITKNRLPI